MVSDSFAKWLGKTIDADESQQWAPHTVDYGAFKSRLKFFTRRRSRLRGMMDESHDGRIHEQVLQTMLAIGPANPNEVAFTQQKNNSVEEHSYVQYVDHDVGADFTYSSDVSSAASTMGGKRKKKESVLRRVSTTERKEMINFLQNETEKVYAFYKQKWGKLTLDFNQMKSWDPFVGKEILEIFAFCVCNVVTIRQVLIRYDAYARTFEGHVMRDYYIKKVTKAGKPLATLSNCSEILALCELYLNAAPSQEHVSVIEFKAQRDMLQGILQSTDGTAVPISHTWKDNFVIKLRTWFLMGGLLEDRLGLEPAYLMLRGQSLALEMKQLADWRENKRANNFDPDIGLPKKLTGMQVFHLTLNLLSAFLYCMNYYIVEPSSTMYVNRLGSPDATQGILMGMTPLGAFVSSLPFSMWTNKSFRHPFVASGTLLIFGNLMYGWADRSRNVEVAMVGRFIVGLGAPKCIIRRYMADTTPMALRTSINASFGMVVAAGSALGPAMAILLNRFEAMVAFPVLGVFALNG